MCNSLGSDKIRESHMSFFIIIKFNNPYNHSVLFMEQKQIVRTQIRQHRTRRMISVTLFAYIMLYCHLNKNEKKHHPTTRLQDICGYFQCASFPRLETGKVVWSCFSTINGFGSTQLSEILMSYRCSDIFLTNYSNLSVSEISIDILSELIVSALKT